MTKKVYCLIMLICSMQYNLLAQNEAAVRGVWVPAPHHTKVLHTYQNVQKFVKLLDSLNFNAIFLVSYAETKTIYPSKVIQDYTNYKNINQTNLLNPYLKNYNQPLKSPTQDPVADL